MYWIAIFYVVCWSASALESSNSLDLSWKTKISFENKTRTTKSCILPAYPENGGYMVPGHPDAKPGDVFEDISYIQYKNVEGDQLVEIKNFKCSSGRWALKIFKYESEKMYFNTSWCDLFQSSPFNKRLTATLSRPAQLSLPPTEQCTLPPYPARGRYSVVNRPSANPGDTLESAHLVYECNYEIHMIGDRDVYCFNNVWSAQPPTCLKCGTLQRFHVLNVTSNTSNFTDNRHGYVGGVDAQLWSVPWHVGLYDKTFTPYKQICGGSIVASNLVITAAHCVWNDIEKLRPASRFAVAGAKIYRPWNHPSDFYSQKSDVSEIKVPPRFRGSQTNFQDDIALLFLSQPFIYENYLIPVCLDFNDKFDARQLRDGNFGKGIVGAYEYAMLLVMNGNPINREVFVTKGWGLISEEGRESEKLQTGWLPSVDIGRCIDDAEPNFRIYITSDKICAGYTNGTALCKGDSGGGLAIPEGTTKEPPHYLRGVVSTAPTNDRACNVYAVTSFTHILAHQYFIKENLNKAIW